MKSWSKIAIIANDSKVGSHDFAAKLGAALHDRCDVCKVLDCSAFSAGALSGIDVCLTIGGDGTVLGLVPDLLADDVVVMPINNGFLGFLSAASTNDHINDVIEYLFSDCKIIKRSVLNVKSESGMEFVALNDVVFKNSERNRVARLEVFCDGEFVNKYSVDGLIVATPTGSTAYNLAADGPIVPPNVNCILLTPILSHGFNRRSVILNANSEIVVRSCSKNSKIYVSCDAVNDILDDVGEIIIKKHKKDLAFICPKDYSFYEILRKKLKW